MTQVRIAATAVYLPGDPIPIAALDDDPKLAERLAPLGQEFTFVAPGRSSTDLMEEAARLLFAQPDVHRETIGQVISAPSLLSGYGFEIPAIALRAKLGLAGADCLNLAQGCVGVLWALEIARQRLTLDPGLGDILIAVGCSASAITDRLTHGAYFWGDGAMALLVTAKPGPGFVIESYAEMSSEQDWGAMRVPFGDSRPADAWTAPDDLRIAVTFPDAQAIADYLAGETRRFTGVIDRLLAARGLQPGDIAAIGLPAFGRNRLRTLFRERRELQERVVTDFRYGHMGGVDPVYFLDRFRASGQAADGAWMLAMTAAFTAQWAGVLLRYRAS